MIKSFTKNGKHYFCKTEQIGWSQWACRHEDGLETWAAVHTPSYKLKRQDVIDAISNIDSQDQNY